MNAVRRAYELAFGVRLFRCRNRRYGLPVTHVPGLPGRKLFSLECFVAIPIEISIAGAATRESGPRHGEARRPAIGLRVGKGDYARIRCLSCFDYPVSIAVGPIPATILIVAEVPVS